MVQRKVPAHVQERTQEHALLDDIHLQAKNLSGKYVHKMSVLVEIAGAQEHMQLSNSVHNHEDEKE